MSPAEDLYAIARDLADQQRIAAARGDVQAPDLELRAAQARDAAIAAFETSPPSDPRAREAMSAWLYPDHEGTDAFSALSQQIETVYAQRQAAVALPDGEV